MFQTLPITMPCAWITLLVTLAAKQGVAEEQVLSGQLTHDDLHDPQARVSLALFIEIAERVRTLTSEPELGIRLGRETRATLWGSVGFATLSAPTLRAALEIAIRYCGVVTPAIALRLREEDGQAEIILEERADFGPARDLVLFWLLLGIRSVGKVMTGSRPTSDLELAIAEPAYFKHIGEPLPFVRFGAPCNRLLVPSTRLDTPYLLHDPSALRMALALCERQREALGLGESIASRVQALVASSSPLPTLEEAARKLSLSSRTLTRRLAQENTSFHQLVDQERRIRALTLVRSEAISLLEIAARLGYSNVANFERAFRRWEGRSPAQYRDARRGNIAEQLSQSVTRLSY